MRKEENICHITRSCHVITSLLLKQNWIYLGIVIVTLNNTKLNHTVQKWSCPWRITSVNGDLITFTEEILVGKRLWPGWFPGIAGNPGYHGNDEKLYESHKIPNQI